MQLEQIHSFLVRPEKAATGTGTVRDVQVGTSDPLNQELTRIFIGSDAECRTDIVFAPDIDGQQKNAAHDCILGYARHPSDSTGRAVAERLQKVTPTSAGYGLLFLFKGKDSDGQEVLVLSRVPAEAGMVARETSQIMTVDFIERVFRKRSTAYKSALFKTFSLSAGFHLGRAVDRQTHAKVELAQYWINDFLECKLNLQGPLGSRRLGIGMAEAVKNTDDPETKQELFAVTVTMRNQDGKTQSARNLLRGIGASDDVIHAIADEMPNLTAMDEVFTFQVNEFDRHIRFRIVELDNGAMLIANYADFPEVYEVERLASGNRLRFSTSGTIIKEQYRKSK